MKLALIAALADNRVIGQHNALPWRLADDLKRFKALTLGHPVIMGRKTWESLGRPLPGRTNLVVSRQPDYRAEGAQRLPSLQAALAVCAQAPLAFVIGGAELYAQALPQADLLYLTEVHCQPEGDAVFPPLPPGQFVELARTAHPADIRNQYPYSFVDYRRA